MRGPSNCPHGSGECALLETSVYKLPMIVADVKHQFVALFQGFCRCIHFMHHTRLPFTVACLLALVAHVSVWLMWPVAQKKTDVADARLELFVKLGSSVFPEGEVPAINEPPEEMLQQEKLPELEDPEQAEKNAETQPAFSSDDVHLTEEANKVQPAPTVPRPRDWQEDWQEDWQKFEAPTELPDKLLQAFRPDFYEEVESRRQTQSRTARTGQRGVVR